MPAPLFVKYRSSAGSPYVYDLGTGEILKLGEVAYEIIDDFRVLEDDELAARNSHLDSADVWNAIEGFHEIQGRGYLRDHEPRIPDRARYALHGGDVLELEELFGTKRSCLVLGLTERCNLRCDYCPFGELYPRFRTHNEKQMPREVAERAVLEHLGQDQEISLIALYGGEPLLNWDLLKHVVVFAEVNAEAMEKKVLFTVTTNGTLLSPDKLAFLVEHGVCVAISLDGPRDAHDRYRIFNATHHEDDLDRRVGSFDLIMRNIRRFIELYPDYLRRAIMVTLARPYDLEGTRELIDELWPKFPLSRVSFVNDEYGAKFATEGIRPKQTGCAPSSSCKSNDVGSSGGCSTGAKASSSSSPLLPVISSGSSGGCGSGGGVQSDEARSILRYAEETRAQAPAAPSSDDAQFLTIQRQYIADKATHGANLQRESPFANMVFRDQMNSFHERRMSPVSGDAILFNYKCLPGFTRLFCDVQGRYYVCERCESTETTFLGDVWSGFQPTGSLRLMEQYRHIADCGNCIAQRHCSNCFTSFQQKSDGNGPAGEAYDYACQMTRKGVAGLLQRYTDVMELNPGAFDDETNATEMIKGPDTKVLLAAGVTSGETEWVGLEELSW